MGTKIRYHIFLFFQFWSDYFFRAPQDNIVKTLVRNRVDTYVYVQNTTVEALRLPWWRQITHNLEHYFLSGAPFMDKVFFPEGQQVILLVLIGLKVWGNHNYFMVILWYRLLMKYVMII